MLRPKFSNYIDYFWQLKGIKKSIYQFDMDFTEGSYCVKINGTVFLLYSSQCLHFFRIWINRSFPHSLTYEMTHEMTCPSLTVAWISFHENGKKCNRLCLIDFFSRGGLFIFYVLFYVLFVLYIYLFWGWDFLSLFQHRNEF